MMGVLHFGDILRRHARITPHRMGARDACRSMTFALWNRRACRLANALLGLGLTRGDRLAVLAYNCVEWMEIYAAAAKAGLVVVPVNFRLVASEILYIVDDCEARALIVQDALVDPVEEVRQSLPVREGLFIHFGPSAPPPGFVAYEDLITAAGEGEPAVAVAPHDPWTLMYTSGTTGKPKGAIRNHGAGALLGLTTALEMGFGAADTALLVLPMCHANSLFFASTMAYCGGGCSIYTPHHFDPEQVLVTLADGGETFTSLVPTQFVMILDLPPDSRAGSQTARVAKLMISSAPAAQDTKRAIMDCFPKAGLFEGYGSTEAGWVTMLHPQEQFAKLGSIGRECLGCGPLRLLGGDGEEVPDGEVGELYSRTPYAFDGYWKLPEKTRESFRGAYCTVNDMARRDPEGYYFLVDRKSNMIISGGENIYPSEVEAVLVAHPDVRVAAVVGTPDRTWGEQVHAVVVLRDGASTTAQQLIDWCRPRLAGYKRPRVVSIIDDADMPRTVTGKIQHRSLKNRLAERLTPEARP